jgi:hypothetical protein
VEAELPQWAWSAASIVVVVLLFVFLYKVGGGEPLDRQDSGAGHDVGPGHGGHSGDD